MSYDVRPHKFANNSWGKLTSAISSGTTSIAVTSGAGVTWPSLSPGDIFKAVIFDVATGAREIVNCTQFVGATMTVERGKEGTSAQAFPAGSVIQHSITAETLEWFEAQV